MAKKTKASSSLSLSYEGFGGIGAKESHNGGIIDLINLRVCADGSLKKRSGYKAIYSSDKEIRAIWSGYIGGIFECYFLAGRGIYRLDLATGTATIKTSIPESSGKAQFFYFGDYLYLIDGSNMYRLRDSYAISVKGYVPLFGKDWDTGYPGQINEPLNILHRRARITYKVGERVSAYLPTMYPVETINALYKNGELVDAESYEFDPLFNTINISGLATGDELEANVTFAEDEAQSAARAELLSSRNACVFGGINSSRLFLWNGSTKNKIFSSLYVDEESCAASEARYTGAGPLYFVAGSSFTVGDGRYNVKAVTRHFDRLLILTDGDAWIADSTTTGLEEFPVMSVNSSAGCSSEQAVALIGNDPVSIGRHAIYRWTSDTDEYNECNAYSISEPISDMLGDSFYKNARVFYHRRRDEVWFSDADCVWIYSPKRDAWFRFGGISAVDFFDGDDEVGFSDGHSLYIFDPSLHSDLLSVGAESGREIAGELVSAICDFGYAGYKRLLQATLKADTQNSELTLTLTTDRGEVIEDTVIGLGYHDVITRRIPSHRFKTLEFRLSMRGEDAQTLHSLEIETR